LVETLRTQPTWSDVPVIMLTTGGTLTVESRRAVRVLSPHANLTLLERPVRRMTLVTAVLSAIRARRRQYAMRTQLDERKALLDQAERSRAVAERANRAKDEFLAILSHELRSPLQGIRGWVAIMRRPLILEQQRARALDTIDRIVTAQAQLVNDLLDVSRVAAGKLEVERAPVELAPLLRAVCDERLPDADAKNIALSCVVEDVGIVIGDAERLRQVFTNLIANAIKFTPNGGSVRVECLPDASREAVVKVRDTGVGIDPEFLPHVFDRFTQADTSSTRRHGGLGLGLAIARHLIEVHGGRIAAESPGPGRGATFIVSLPIGYAVDAAVARPRDGQGAGVRLHGIRVLVVEDDADALEALRLVLEQSGAEVAAATSAADALDVFAAAPPDVLVSDISMPGEDGYALLARVRAGARASTPAVALTGFASPEDRARAVAAGFQAHVAKPVDPAALISLVHKLAQRGSHGP
jgi:signal transduction histidine kinase